LGYFFWNDAVDFLRLQLEGWAWMEWLGQWLDRMGLEGVRLVLAPALLLFASIPFIVVASLLMVAMFMMPAMVSLVSERRFAGLERKKGGSFWGSLAWSLGSTLAACLALLLSVPLWLIPPLVLILPPLIWGWLTYRVMAYDALADHASTEERRLLFKTHRFQLLGIGIVSGYLGALPSVLWASGAMFIAMAPVLVPLAIWIYMLVFAFASLWFAHYALAALAQLRALPVASTGPAQAVVAPLPLEPRTVPSADAGDTRI
jgi:MFS family permease